MNLFKDSGKQLLLIVNDILDSAKIDAGRFALEEREFNIRQAVFSLKGLFEGQIQSKDLRLSAWVSPHIPERLVGDPGRLRQVLSNLIGNAIKFTRQGQVEIVVKPWQNGGGPSVSMNTREYYLFFSVSDTGPGIPQDKIELIFDHFTQIDDSLAKQYQGTGLGLSISKKLVELMGGRIWAKSELGEGSRFCFTVALRFPEGVSPVPLAPRPVEYAKLPALKILLAEDNRINRILAQRLLENQGHQTTAVEDGPRRLGNPGGS